MRAMLALAMMAGCSLYEGAPGPDAGSADALVADAGSPDAYEPEPVRPGVQLACEARCDAEAGCGTPYADCLAACLSEWSGESNLDLGNLRVCYIAQASSCDFAWCDDLCGWAGGSCCAGEAQCTDGTECMVTASTPQGVCL